jgi:glutamate formiminotransferase
MATFSSVSTCNRTITWPHCLICTADVYLCLQLASCVARLAAEAASTITLQQHVAKHPRLGVVDHIVCQYLPQQAAGKAIASAAARRAGALISQAIPELPVVLYGDACEQQRKLQDVRRACGEALPSCRRHDVLVRLLIVSSVSMVPAHAGYFKGADGLWSGFGAMHVGVEPDFGPKVMHARLGLCTIGAVPLVTNFNLLTSHLDMAAGTHSAARSCAACLVAPVDTLCHRDTM